MKNEHRKEWNRRYREGDHHTEEAPSPLLEDWEPRIPTGRALDSGCGAGRNALFLARRGFEVDAIDYSEEALKIARNRARERDLDVNWIHSDIGEMDFPENEYDVVVISFFHPQDNLLSVKNSLKEGGFFLFEHHISTEDSIDRGPKNRKFRFEPNELLEIFSDFQVLFYAEGIETYEDGERSAIARIVCRKSSDFEKDLPSISDFLVFLGSSVERLF